MSDELITLFCKEMKPDQEAKLFKLGFLFVYEAIIILGALAFLIDSRFGFWAGGLVVASLIVRGVKSKVEKRRVHEALVSAFDTFRGARPEVKRSDIYGHPFFSIQFASKEDMIDAFESGQLSEFRTSIARLYSYGVFRISRGFDETYVGWEADYTAAISSDPENNAWEKEMQRLRDLHYPSCIKEAEQGGDGDAEEFV